MKSLNKITLKYILLNKKRSIITILSIVLSATLLFSLGLVFSSYRGTMLKEMDKEEYNWHIILENRTEKDLTKIENAKFYKQGINLMQTEDEKYIGFFYTNNKELYDIKGTYPKKENEIGVSKNYEEYKIGDKITIEGLEYTITCFYDHLSFGQIDSYKISHNFLEKNLFLSYIPKENIRIILKFDNVKKAYDQIEKLTDKLRIKANNMTNTPSYEGMQINHDYLQIQGNIVADPFTAVLALGLLVGSFAVGLFCVVIIYNSFAMSVIERKKLYGILQCLGATEKKIYKSVFAEAFMEAIVAIPIGLLASVVVTKLGINIFNQILEGLNVLKIDFYIDGLFVVIPGIFLFLVVYFGMYRNADMVKRIPPIEAIRSNKDIKTKSKKKESKFIKKIFGPEGVLAFENMRRSKNNYRSTIIAISICLVLFITMATFIKFLEEKYLSQYKNIENHISLHRFSVLDNDNLINDLINTKAVNDYEYKLNGFTGLELDNIQINEKFKRNIMNGNLYFQIVYSNKMDKLLKEYDTEVLIKNFQNDCDDNNCEFITNKNDIKEIKIGEDKKPINNFKYANYNELFYNYNEFTIFVSEKVFRNLVTGYDEEILINDKDGEAVHKEVTRLIKKYKLEEDSYYYENAYKEMIEVKKILLAGKFVLFSVVFLLSLISLTGIINAIYNSIQNRKREFAVLKSLGISEYKFDKMILIETFAICLKSLFFGLGISILGIEYAREKSREATKFGEILIEYPNEYIIFSVLIVLVIMTTTMLYAVSKTKKDNIIETIRNENV